MAEQDHELTENIRQKMCEALRIGASYELAARYAGIQVKYFWRWKKQSKNVVTSISDPNQQRCIDFFADVRQARADYEMAYLMKLEKHGGKNWKPLQWKYLHLLEARLSGNQSGRKNKKRNEVHHEHE